MKRSAFLIHNPVAGQGNPQDELQQICDFLEPEFDLEIQLTTEEIDADRLAEAALQAGASLIIASGGDGTLSATAQALVGTDIPLGLISRGTANAFAKALGIPETLEGACQTILQGHTRVVDAASCNGRRMVLLAGIGFGAEMIAHADRAAKDRFGVMAYILAGMQQLRQLESFQISIKTEDEIIVGDAVAVTVANAAPITSILAQAPEAVIVDDGLLDVTIISPETKAGAIAAGFQLLQSAIRGTAKSTSSIDYRSVRAIKIEADPPQKVAVDGEIVGFTPIEVECIPKGLIVFVPCS